MKSVDQMKQVVVTVVLAGYWAQWYDPLWSRTYQLNGALWPIAVTKEIDRIGVLGGHCAKQMLLYQTQRSKATHNNLRLLLVLFIIRWNLKVTVQPRLNNDTHFSCYEIPPKRVQYVLLSHEILRLATVGFMVAWVCTAAPSIVKIAFRRFPV